MGFLENHGYKTPNSVRIEKTYSYGYNIHLKLELHFQVVKRCESWKGKIQMANISLANRGIVWEPEPQNEHFMMDNDKSLNFWVTILFFKQTTYSRNVSHPDRRSPSFFFHS